MTEILTHMLFKFSSNVSKESHNISNFALKVSKTYIWRRKLIICWFHKELHDLRNVVEQNDLFFLTKFICWDYDLSQVLYQLVLSLDLNSCHLIIQFVYHIHWLWSDFHKFFKHIFEKWTKHFQCHSEGFC